MPYMTEETLGQLRLASAPAAAYQISPYTTTATAPSGGVPLNIVDVASVSQREALTPVSPPVTRQVAVTTPEGAVPVQLPAAGTQIAIPEPRISAPVVSAAAPSPQEIHITLPAHEDHEAAAPAPEKKSALPWLQFGLAVASFLVLSGIGRRRKRKR